MFPKRVKQDKPSNELVTRQGSFSWKLTQRGTVLPTHKLVLSGSSTAFQSWACVLAPELKSSRQSLQVLVQRETALLTPLREAWWRSGEVQLCLLAAVPFFQLSNEADKSRLAPQGRCGNSINCEALGRGKVYYNYGSFPEAREKMAESAHVESFRDPFPANSEVQAGLPLKMHFLQKGACLLGSPALLRKGTS